MSIRENEDAAGDPVRSVQPPLLSRDYDFFMEGLRQRELRVQRCNDCGTLRHVPMPMCPKCNAFEWTAQLLCGRGRVYSYTILHHPPIPPYRTPHPIALVTMEEGVRILAAFNGAPESLRIDLPVRVEFVEIAGGAMLHRFVADGGAR